MSAWRAAVLQHLDVCVFVALFVSYFYYFSDAPGRRDAPVTDH